MVLTFPYNPWLKKYVWIKIYRCDKLYRWNNLIWSISIKNKKIHQKPKFVVIDISALSNDIGESIFVAQFPEIAYNFSLHAV